VARGDKSPFWNVPWSARDSSATGAKGWMRYTAERDLTQRNGVGHPDSLASIPLPSRRFVLFTPLPSVRASPEAGWQGNGGKGMEWNSGVAPDPHLCVPIPPLVRRSVLHGKSSRLRLVIPGQRYLKFRKFPLPPALSHTMGEGGASFRDGSFAWPAVVVSSVGARGIQSCNRDGKRFTLAHRMGEGKGEGFGTGTLRLLKTTEHTEHTESCPGSDW
jgi:hypothetical protein